MLQLDKNILIFDGGMGSELEARGLDMNKGADLNIEAKEDIKAIHKAYSSADFITTNTFGVNRLKYHGKYSLKEVIDAAIDNALAAGKNVMFDIGPTGQMLKPIGMLTFDEAYEAFKEVVLLSRDKVDGYILETFSDLYEIKAAILAVKENTDKPCFATMTFDKTGRTLTGSTPEIVVNTLEGLGVDALGCNCGLGPDALGDVIIRMINCSHKPILIQPNRDLPQIKNGKTFYAMEKEEFFRQMGRYVNEGVSIVGGCCGTTPEFIDLLAKYRTNTINKKNNPYKTLVNSSTELVEIDGVICCGERLNPTGKKKLKEMIINGNFDYLVEEAIKQVDNGAKVLDLNLGVPKTDEVTNMKNVVPKIQEYCQAPLQIDSSNKEALEMGCRYYNGIPIINSVNGEEAVMDRVFPIAKKYGACVVGLALDEHGVPKTAEERFEIAKRIIKRASEYGIPKERLIIDTLVLTASSEQPLVQETLKGLTLVRSLGVKTCLGVSNVSFGLPNRGMLNKNFLAMAIFAGLNMPIMNPSDNEMMGTIDATNVLLNRDEGSMTYINKYNNVVIQNTFVSNGPKEEKQQQGELTLFDAVCRGLKNEIKNLTLKELESHDAMYVINDILIKALGKVGDDYSKGTLYLPQLIASAEAAKLAFSVISEKFPKDQSKSKGDIVMCTVKGDVHDIGKNICKVVLESYGYNVIDLGKDTPIEAVLDAYNKYHPIVIGLSALMTTTVIEMENTIKALREIGCKAKIFVGGAVVTKDIAKEINADYYSDDALELVTMIEDLIEKGIIKKY